MNKLVVLISFLIAIAGQAIAQVNTLWTSMLGANSIEYASSLTQDKNGNIFMAGNWNTCAAGDSSLQFGSLTSPPIGSELYTSFFVTKTNSNGQPLWLRTATLGHLGSVTANAVATDNTGNCYVSGIIIGPATIGNYHFNTFASNYIWLDFLTKYDPNGNLLWVKTPIPDSTGEVAIYSIVTDKLGYIYIAGTFNGSMTIAGTKLTSLYNAAAWFLVKLDPSGNAIWAQSPNGYASSNNATSDAEPGRILTIDKNDRLIFTGSFSSATIQFGSYTLTNMGNTSNIYSASANTFLVKYDLNGNVLWAKQASAEPGLQVITDHSNNIYITGGVPASNSNFNFVPLWGPTLFYLAKYDSTGQLLWTTQSSSTAIGTYLSVDSCNEVFASGYTTAGYQDSNISIQYQTYYAGKAYQASYGGSGFILKFDSMGNIQNGTIAPTYFIAAYTCAPLLCDNAGNLITDGVTYTGNAVGCYSTGYITKLLLGTPCHDTILPPMPPPPGPPKAGDTCQDFTVPNVFTPNGDGVNDQFVINAVDMQDYHIDIYNRWGIKVFNSSSAAISWNGTEPDGQPVTDGVYFYLITANCNGKLFTKKGFVEVIK